VWEAALDMSYPIRAPGLNFASASMHPMGGFTDKNSFVPEFSYGGNST
jgi:hypothetical protein